MRVFGHAVEAALDQAVDKGKRKKDFSNAEKKRKRTAVLEQWLGIEPVRKFKDPAAGGK